MKCTCDCGSIRFEVQGSLMLDVVAQPDGSFVSEKRETSGLRLVCTGCGKSYSIQPFVTLSNAPRRP